MTADLDAAPIARKRPTRSSVGHSGTGPSGAGGFSLIEMVVVVAVLGLALSIVAGFSPKRSTRLQVTNAAETVAQAMRASRMRAITSGQAVLFDVDATRPAYSVDGAMRALPSGLRLSGERLPIRFMPDGSASSGAVRVANAPVGADRAASQALTVTVEWLTGRVRVVDAGGSDARR